MKRFASLFVLITLFFLPLYSFQQKPPPESRPETTLLKLLEITPSRDSIDFIQNKTSFFLQHILTEQPHPKTRNFSQLTREDHEKGLSPSEAYDIMKNKGLVSYLSEIIAPKN